MALFDSALWDGRATVAELEAAVERWRHLGGSRELLEALALARPGAQTVLETLSRLALMAEGLPEPELQVEFRDDEGLIGRVDMSWPGLGVIGEADGLLSTAVELTSCERSSARTGCALWGSSSCGGRGTRS